MRNKKGLTLLEVIVVLALVSAVSLIMYAFFGQGLKLFTYESKSVDIQTNLREVMSDITNRVRLTDSSKITYSSGVLTLDADKYELSGNKLNRNGAAIASGISSFTAEIKEKAFNNNTVIVKTLSVTIINTEGTSLSTSISLTD